MQPLLRWAGSKRSLVPELLGHYDSDSRRYIEPFCGSAALYFEIGPKPAILSDINSDLINFYSVLRTRAADIYDYVTSMRRSKSAYYAARDRFNSTKSHFVRASLFYYLNKNCFNGLFRTSKKGHFNVPHSPARVGEYPSFATFENCANALKHARFVCGDFESVLSRNARRGDFVYLDPPYSDASRYPFREYFPGCFSHTDIERLIGLLDHLDEKGVHFVLTFSDRLDVPFSKRKWLVRPIRTRRNISGFASARKYVDDLLVTNFRASR